MAIVTALYGHTNFETAYLVPSYPYGRLRCKMWFWLETKPKKGVRFVSQSENPKNGRMNKPHASTYALLSGNMYLDENGHCQWATLSEYSSEKEAYEFIKNFPDNHQMAELKVWCLVKYKWYRTAVEKKQHLVTIGNQDKNLSEPELERYTQEMRGWWKAYLLAAGKPEDTQEPALKGFVQVGD